MSTWLVTGCSTGLGRAFAQAALEHGHDVVVTARNPGQLEDFERAYPDSALTLALDVTDHDRIDEVVAAGVERFGSIDVLVNNAGYGYRAAVEEGEDAAVRMLFETHFFGPLKLIQAVLPAMRARRSGAIVNISSIGARMSWPGLSSYAAVKAGIEAMTSSLRKEVAPLGITAMILLPGGFRTAFVGSNLTQSRTPIADYAATAGLRRKEQVQPSQHGDPAKAAEALISVIEGPEPPLMLALGPDAVDLFRGALEGLAADIDAFETVSRSTSFDE
jgi:NAD(P)-dependent dehydrogenase (short-subunit alcohol dehydrogenase family)